MATPGASSWLAFPAGIVSRYITARHTTSSVFSASGTKIGSSKNGSDALLHTSGSRFRNTPIFFGARFGVNCQLFPLWELDRPPSSGFHASIRRVGLLRRRAKGPSASGKSRERFKGSCGGMGHGLPRAVGVTASCTARRSMLTSGTSTLMPD